MAMFITVGMIVLAGFFYPREEDETTAYYK